MTKEDVLERIMEVLADEFEVDRAKLVPSARLFEDLDLDSIDALEIGAALRKKYQVKFKANSDENRVHFRTIASLADFIAANAGLMIEG